MERDEEIGTSFGKERRSDSEKRDEEKDRYTGHEACAGIYSTAPDLFEGFGRRISRTPVDSFLPEGCSTVDDGTAILVILEARDSVVVALWSNVWRNVLRKNAFVRSGWPTVFDITMKSPPIVETCSSPEGDEAFANGALARMKVIENINDKYLLLENLSDLKEIKIYSLMKNNFPRIIKNQTFPHISDLN